MSDTDVIGRLKASPMSTAQIVAALFCAFAIITDGYDTVSMSLAAPFVLKTFVVGPKALGAVFSALALGMVVGAFLGSLADRVGRRTVIIAASASVAALMVANGLASTITQFVIIRFLVGCGIGTMVVCLNVMALEYANHRLNGLFVSLVHVGIGLGAMLGSVVAIAVIGSHGWRWIFYAGAAMNVVVVGGGLLLLPESIEFLLTRRPSGALERLNQGLRRFRQPTIEILPPRPIATSKRPNNLRGFFGPQLLFATLLLALASFSHFTVAYFHNSWAPKLLLDAGLVPEVALSSGFAAGLGSIGGNLLVGVFTARFDARWVTAASFGLGAIALFGFGIAHGHAAVLLGSAALVSLFSSATNTGVYLCAARSYPSALRGSGVGLVAGIGRIGAVIGPSLGGTLMALGWGRASYYPIFAAFYLIGGLAIALSARYAIAAPNE